LAYKRRKCRCCRKWKFAVDTGGTFTDIIGLSPDGRFHALKVLTRSPEYKDAGIEGIRQILKLPADKKLPQDQIEAIRFGTTAATNALLERKGGRVALFITEGLSDLLEIGYQDRPDIFALCIRKPANLYSKVFEIEERIDSTGRIVRQMNREKVCALIERLKKKQVDAVAVVLMHSWKNPKHELICKQIFSEYGMNNVFLSHVAMNSIKIVSRGQSTVIDAYLSVVLHQYLMSIRNLTGTIDIAFMQSSGKLSSSSAFCGKNALFSGPAGGAIAIGVLSDDAGIKGAIGFDMGGTSTDVSRYDGRYEKRFERTINGILFQTEMLNVTTIASGGGSILWFDGQKMRVGPESAGAMPGPACYGFGGPLTITDANLLTGRILPEYFPRTFGAHRNSTLERAIVQKKMKALTNTIKKASHMRLSIQDTALGYLNIANENMAMAIKEISVAKGFDVRNYALVSFGGAGGQHACAVASILGIRKIIAHPFNSLLSAYGIGLSKKAENISRTVFLGYDRTAHAEIAKMFMRMSKSLLTRTRYKRYVLVKEIDIRMKGADTFLTIPFGTYTETLNTFMSCHKQLYGFIPEDSSLEAVNVRLEIQDTTNFFGLHRERVSDPLAKRIKPVSYHKICFENGFRPVPVYLRDQLPAHKHIKGPACIVEKNSTLIVDPGYSAHKHVDGIISIEKVAKKSRTKKQVNRKDPVLLEIFSNLFRGIASEMGFVLQNTACSVNMKERRDFSCAIFDRKGDLVANAPHIPVHLGSMTETVKSIIREFKGKMQAGDMYLTNNPYRGGSHLPDLTVVCPVFSEAGEIIFYTAARGHHADIGGISPGSLPPYSGHIEEEGVVIDALLLLRENRFREREIRTIFEKSPHPVRNVNERIHDLKAQIASCIRGKTELDKATASYGLSTVTKYMRSIQENACFSVQQALGRFLRRKSIFRSSFEDYLDDGSRIHGTISIHGGSSPPKTLTATVDFSGTSHQHQKDNLNAPLPVVHSCILYVLRALTGDDIPLNSGCLQPVEIIVPKKSLLNPEYPAPVASGNVETSQRIVDVLLGALGICAASQGTMNNLLFEIDGDVPYYETVAGGAGAMQGCCGASGVQVHMTNTRMTDPEILEVRHPHVRLQRFILRRRSGGKGLYRGGDGIIRELLFLKQAIVCLISERRNYGPYGLKGGRDGQKGINFLRKPDGSVKKLPHRIEFLIQPGEALVIKTPGGGGFG
jgi:5-oxoprolinase (ATP-hydrolysing)